MFVFPLTKAMGNSFDLDGRKVVSHFFRPSHLTICAALCLKYAFAEVPPPRLRGSAVPCGTSHAWHGAAPASPQSPCSPQCLAMDTLNSWPDGQYYNAREAQVDQLRMSDYQRPRATPQLQDREPQAVLVAYGRRPLTLPTSSFSFFLITTSQ